MALKRSINQEEDHRVEQPLLLFKQSVAELVSAEPKDLKATVSAELLQKMDRLIHNLNSKYQQLKEKDRPAEELTTCQLHLATLHRYCPILCTQSAPKARNNLKRILIGLTHCGNALFFAQKVTDAKLKKDFIIRAITLVTELLGDPKAGTALGAMLENKRKTLLRNLRGHLEEGLQALKVTHHLSAEEIKTYQTATTLIRQYLTQPEERVELLAKPLAGFGSQLGLLLARANEEPLVGTVAWMGLMAATGSQIGGALDEILTELQQPPRAAEGHFSFFKKSLAPVGGAVFLYFAATSGVLPAGFLINLAGSGFAAAFGVTFGYRAGALMDQQVDQCQQARKMKLS